MAVLCKKEDSFISVLKKQTIILCAAGENVFGKYFFIAKILLCMTGGSEKN